METFEALRAMVLGPDIWVHVATSLKRVAVGLGFAILFGEQSLLFFQASLLLAVWGRKAVGITAYGDPEASRAWSELGV